MESSPRTISRYRDFIRIWLKHAGDVPLNQITTDSLCAFLIWLRASELCALQLGNVDMQTGKVIA